MTYTSFVHAAAVAAVRTAQSTRTAADQPAAVGVWDIPSAEHSARAIESIAPENVGTRADRVATLTARTRLAAAATRIAARRRRMTGPTP